VITELWAFALVMALGQFSPGPDMVLLTRTALAEGLKAGWQTVAGIVTGLSLHATIAIAGMAVILSRDGWFPQTVKVLAAGYLAWLAFGLLKSSVNPGAEENRAELPVRAPYLRGLWCNLLNPKVAVFFAGAVAPFLDGERPEWWSLAIWGVIVFEGLLLWCLWVWVLQWGKCQRAYQKTARWIDGGFGIALLTLALLLLLR